MTRHETTVGGLTAWAEPWRTWSVGGPRVCDTRVTVLAGYVRVVAANDHVTLSANGDLARAALQAAPSVQSVTLALPTAQARVIALVIAEAMEFADTPTVSGGPSDV